VEDAMTMDDDARQLAEISKELPSIDLDATTAELIARRARQDVGKGPSRRRLILPIITGITTAAYLAWLIIKLIEVLG
jgi:hypothetical protein